MNKNPRKSEKRNIEKTINKIKKIKKQNKKTYFDLKNQEKIM